MSHPHRTLWATVAVVLCVATVAVAYDPRRHSGAVVIPARGGGETGGELLGDAWALGLVQPADQPDAFAGTCVTLARDVIAPHPDNGTATCAGTPHTRLLVFWGSECSNRDDPPAETRAAQLACVIDGDRAIKSVRVTVDDGDTIDIVRSRFELISPQRTVELPPDNVFGTDERTATFTAHAWGAVIRSLRPGRHIVTVAVALDPNERFTLTTVLTIQPDGRTSD
jgi:hypothetical protein